MTAPVIPVDLDSLARSLIEPLGELLINVGIPEGLAAVTNGLASVPVGAIASGVSSVLRAGADALDAVAEADHQQRGALTSAWGGQAAQAASTSSARTRSQAKRIGADVTTFDRILDEGAAVVGKARSELLSIARSFFTAAAETAATITTPPGQLALVVAAIDHLARAIAVVVEAEAKLATQCAQMDRLHLDPLPDGLGPDADPAGSVTATGRGRYGFASADAGAAPATASAAARQVLLPDGSTALAPSPAAAGAVRAALSQRGVPYTWGGTAPGQGMDCSGLTQWAYGQSGVALPRLAQEQTVGTRVPSSEVEPGDLAVWDGHVAMAIGNGQLVEAGNPVQVSSLRTTNAGMAFKGFYRPTGTVQA